LPKNAGVPYDRTEGAYRAPPKTVQGPNPLSRYWKPAELLPSESPTSPRTKEARQFLHTRLKGGRRGKAKEWHRTMTRMGFSMRAEKKGNHQRPSSFPPSQYGPVSKASASCSMCPTTPSFLHTSERSFSASSAEYSTG
jgi:hypothetical protein